MSADETKDREDHDDEAPPEKDGVDAADTINRDPDKSDESDSSDSSDSSEEPREPDEEPWAEKVKLARQLWDAGDNARLRGVLDELEKAPAEEEEARALAADLRRRLRPDPVAIALWVLTFLVFCVLTYMFVIR